MTTLLSIRTIRGGVVGVTLRRDQVANKTRLITEVLTVIMKNSPCATMTLPVVSYYIYTFTSKRWLRAPKRAGVSKL